jgi:C-terminal processing protease CtpA/Prc
VDDAGAARVAHVAAGSSAHVAGVRVGDRIVSVDGLPTNGAAGAEEALGQGGPVARITLDRAGSRRGERVLARD